MKKMAAPLLTLALLAPPVSAAPAAPDRAKEKLEALKKKLPEVVQRWHETYGCFKRQGGPPAEIRVARRVGPTEAKVTILVPGISPKGQRYPASDKAVNIYLSFYDGSWTSSRYEISSQAKESEGTIPLLMLAIDELGEK